MIVLENIHKTYGERIVLSGINLQLKAGRITALLGVNGAGKSSLINIIAGLQQASLGDIYWQGLKTARIPPQDIGLAPQELGIYPDLTVQQNLRFFAELQGIWGKSKREAMEEVAMMLDIHPLFKQKAGLLSGGQQRRLHTACALIHKPKLVLLDEPTVGADPVARRQILSAVRYLAEQGAAILYTSHYFPEIEQLDAHIAIMKTGQIVCEAEQQALLQRHGDNALVLQFTHHLPINWQQNIPNGCALDDCRLMLVCDKPTECLPNLLQHLGKGARDICHIDIQQPNLESVFLKLNDQGEM